MKRTLMTATVAAAALFAAGNATFAQQQIASVDVTVDADAIENVEAARFWSSLEGDLEQAILVLVADRTDEEGYFIDIDLDEVNLATSFQGALGVESHLVGDVKLTNSQEVSEISFYNLKIRALQDGMTYGEGEVFSMAETEEYYDALIGKFAEEVVKRLD